MRSLSRAGGGDLDLDGVLLDSEQLWNRTAARMTVIAVPNPHYPPTDDALKLAAATVDAIADLTPKLVERVAG